MTLSTSLSAPSTARATTSIATIARQPPRPPPRSAGSAPSRPSTSSPHRQPRWRVRGTTPRSPSADCPSFSPLCDLKQLRVQGNIKTQSTNSLRLRISSFLSLCPMQQFINSVNFFVRSAPAALTFSIISCDLEIEQLIICAATRPPGWTATARRRDTLPRPPTIPLFAPLSRRIFCSRRCSRRRRLPPPRSFPPRSPLPRSHLCLERGMDFLGIVHFANFDFKKKS